MENTSSEKILKSWSDVHDKFSSMGMDTAVEERNAAIAFCRSVYDTMKISATESDYADFLGIYVQLLMYDDNLVQEEISRQEELLKIRQKQASENREKYFPRYTNGLFYLGYAYMRARDSWKAMSYMEQAVENERVISREMPDAKTNGLALATYMLARVYDTFARKILAEDAYKDAIAEYKNLADKTTDNKKIYETMADIMVEFAEFYWFVPFINKALDRYWQAIELYRNLLPDESIALKLKALYELLINRYSAMGNEEQCERLRKMLLTFTLN